MSPQESHEHYRLLLAACNDLTPRTAYRRLREMLEQTCRAEARGNGLQMTDLSARIRQVAVKHGLTAAEENRLHTFRLTGNEVLNHRREATREELMRDVKTLAFFLRRLSGEEIPQELRRCLPQADATYLAAPPARQRVKRMRATFVRAEGQRLYVAPSDRADGQLLAVRYGVAKVNEEFDETCRRLWPGAQLNLLDVAVDDEGVLTPSIIVLEPDFLIDISSLAECFKDYGHHPGNYLLGRLRPSENTRPLLLGNIANLFLDEWIHAEDEPDYLHCMQKAFRTYPIELAACEELRDAVREREFFADCRRHFDNLRTTVRDTFPAPGYGLDRNDAVLEPSYICEALGLQGRLDYMQRDMSAFIEMKSGKADEYTIPGKVSPRENNRVQMQLYQAVLEYAMGMDHRNVRAYLLYTRYPLLYPARPSWALVRRAVEVRNRIVATEYAIQRHNDPAYTARLFEALTPDRLNERGLHGRLWTQYQAPAIATLTDRLRSLPPTAKAYFYTLYNFITKELYTSKSGDTAEHEGRSGAASLWLSTLDEKRETGEILYDLTIRENRAAEAEAPVVVLGRGTRDEGQETREEEISREEESAPLPNFRQGDAVVLYERNGTEDNVTNRLVFKGYIEEITENTLRFRLRAAQKNADVLPAGSRYAVEHDCMDTGFRGMFGGLHAFLFAPERRRALLLGERLPERDEAYDPLIALAEKASKEAAEGKGDTAINADADTPGKVQAAADFRRVILKAQAARDYFLLVGPPGTGKTSRALRGMVEAFLAEGKQVLLLSYTNRAVDEICKSLSSIRPEADFIRIGNEPTCDPAYRPRLIENILAPCRNRREVQQRLERCPLFVGTVATLSGKTDLFRLKRFDAAIVDEATQILEPQLLGLFCQCTPTGEEAIGRFILIGDHKQLPAVVLQPAEESEVTDSRLRDIGLHNLRDSLFERLYRRLRQSGEAARPYYDMLCLQGRMHEEVADFPNRAFYDGRLRTMGFAHQQGPLVPCSSSPCPSSLVTRSSSLVARSSSPCSSSLVTRPSSPLSFRLAFLPSEPEPPSHPAKVNHSEARIVARLAADIYRRHADSNRFDPTDSDPHSTANNRFDPTRTLGVITPYRSQIALIRRELAATGIPALREIAVDTVERFQGSERDVIIYSFCVNRLSQLRFLAASLTEEEGTPIDRKLNVALTRARKQMFITGVPHLLRQNPLYERLIEYSEQFAHFPD